MIRVLISGFSRVDTVYGGDAGGTACLNASQAESQNTAQFKTHGRLKSIAGVQEELFLD